MLPHRLFRGVHLGMHLGGFGLRPRGKVDIHGPEWGHPEIPYGIGITWGGRDHRTAAIMHQLGGHSYPDSAFISTTPHFSRARDYALYKHGLGVVYELDTASFSAHGVEVHAIDDIIITLGARGDEEAEEHAVLTHPIGSRLPLALVTRVHSVRR